MAMRNSATWRHILPSAWIAEPGLIPSSVTLDFGARLAPNCRPTQWSKPDRAKLAKTRMPPQPAPSTGAGQAHLWQKNCAPSPSGELLNLLATGPRAVALAALHVSESVLLELEGSHLLSAAEISGLLKETTLRNADQVDNRSCALASRNNRVDAEKLQEKQTLAVPPPAFSNHGFGKQVEPAHSDKSGRNHR
jgi:hypothetical protein